MLVSIESTKFNQLHNIIPYFKAKIQAQKQKGCWWSVAPMRGDCEIERGCQERESKKIIFRLQNNLKNVGACNYRVPRALNNYS